MPDYTMKAPGVYIEEQTSTGPIAGVSTSVAAFIGPTQQGPISQPTLITNWTQFGTIFGYYMPDSYMAPAVRGFLDNGGTQAYIVRVGTGNAASLDILTGDEIKKTALRVRARREGEAGNTLKLAVEHVHLVTAEQKVTVAKASATIQSAEGNVITLAQEDEASRFATGDTITLDDGTERVVIDYIEGNQLYLVSNLTRTYSKGTVRIADLQSGQRTFRVTNSQGIEAGSVLHLTQGKTSQAKTAAEPTSEYQTVEKIVLNLVTLSGEGLLHTYALQTNSQDVTVETEEFTLTLTRPDSTREVFAYLSMNPRHSHYFLTNVHSQFIEVELPPQPDRLPAPNNEPAILSGTNLQNGKDNKVSNVTVADYKNALTELAKIEDINLVCVPGQTDNAVQSAVVEHCEFLGNRFAILDSIKGASIAEVTSQREVVGSDRGYAALYYPWIAVTNPEVSAVQATVLMPPSGHLAGVYARSDSQRGVHKAPANETIRGALGLELLMDDNTQGSLNYQGINVLRIFPGQSRPVVWGARTTVPKDELSWRFINVRRLFLFVEESIRRGVSWAVFEPNSVTLWKQLDRTVTEFLLRVWSSGALVGTSASEAFYVKIDDELNPPALQARGEVVMEVGLAPVRPAEFVIVRIGMWNGSSSITEG